MALRARSTSNTDQGVIVAIGCDSTFTPLADSVEFTGTTGVMFRKRFYRVFQAKFHDDSTNVGTISVYHGGSSAGFTSQDSVLAQIPARRTESALETYTTPEGTNTLSIISWVADVTPTFSGFPSPKVGGNLMGHFIDSTAAGSLVLLGREAGGAWREVYSRNFRTPTGVEFVPYRPLDIPVNAGTDLVVAAGVTGAQSDINSRLQIGTK